MMRSVALVMLIVAAVAGEEIEIPEIVGSVKLYNVNDSHLVGAINFLQTGIKLESFIILGHMWGVEPGTYVGLVHERPTSEGENPCQLTGEKIVWRENAKPLRPLDLFTKVLNDFTDYRFISVDGGASLKVGAKNFIMNRVVAIYRISQASLELNPVACGVVVPGLVQPGGPQIPDLMEE